MPAIRPGKGRAAIYVANVGTSDLQSNPHSRAGSSGPSAPAGGTGRFGGMSKRFDGKDSKAHPYQAAVSVSLQLIKSLYLYFVLLQAPALQSTVQPVPAPASAGADEAAQIAAMFAETSEQWEQTQAQMAQ